LIGGTVRIKHVCFGWVPYNINV